MRDIVPIVFSMDDNYAMPTAVAIRSILKYYSRSDIYIYILYKNELSALSKAIIDIGTSSFSQDVAIKIEYICIGKSMDNAKSHIKHISSATYYRILLPELLPQYDKCLYLDGDVLATDDISPLLQYELNDNDFVAGVSTVMIQMAREFVVNRRKAELGIESFDFYINAGVALLNLKALRENRCVEQMLNLVPKNYSVQDQDIINVVCYGKIKLLPPRYNVLPNIYHMRLNKLKKVYNANEINDARNNPCLIHYADNRKPWMYVNVNSGDKWRSVYYEMFAKIAISNKRYGFENEILKLFKKLNYHFQNAINSLHSSIQHNDNYSTIK